MVGLLPAVRRATRAIRERRGRFWRRRQRLRGERLRGFKERCSEATKCLHLRGGSPRPAERAAPRAGIQRSEWCWSGLLPLFDKGRAAGPRAVERAARPSVWGDRTRPGLGAGHSVTFSQRRFQRKIKVSQQTADSMTQFSTKLLIVAGTLCAIATTALSQTVYISSDGIAYVGEQNEHGGKLSRTREIFYLGNDCDLLTSDGVHGFWEWANGGFCLTMPQRSICFPRQEAPVENGGKCWM